MVKDEVTGDFYRADHVLKGFLEKRLKAVGKDSLTEEQKQAIEYELAILDGMDGATLEERILHYDIRSDYGNQFSKVLKFNLMFGSGIGPTGLLQGYMRPETAQGQFVNFRRLLECNNDKMPFASAQIGKSFRNEISPRSGLLRVREFTMAEIEHYVHPDKKNHVKFGAVSQNILPLLSRNLQSQGLNVPLEISIGEAVQKKIVDNETLGYFLVRIYQYLIKIGIAPDCIRFRQHLSNEMAHYASDCWDAEILSSYGWIECVGCADRSAFDLTMHSKKTGEKLVARERYDPPREVEKTEVNLNKKNLGITFKKDAKKIEAYLSSLEEPMLENLAACMSLNEHVLLEVEGETFKLTNEILSLEKKKVLAHVQEYIPNVIEPSFGIGRILYSLLEHSYYQRQDSTGSSVDSDRSVFAFVPAMAPVKVLLAPIMAQEAFVQVLHPLADLLRVFDLSCQVDTSGTSLGKKYARNDEIGIPFSVTIDHQTLTELGSPSIVISQETTATVTLRERDSMKQVRLPMNHLGQLLADLVAHRQTWTQVLAKYPIVGGDLESLEKLCL